MKIHYSRYTGDDFGISAEDLMRALSDFFLQSGFETQYMQFNEMNQQSLDDLKRAIQRALEMGDLFDNERAEQMRQQLMNMSPEELDQLLERLAQKLVDEGYLNSAQEQREPQQAPGGGGRGDKRVKLEITDKSLDFLGYKTLKDLLGSLGKSSFGAHDTRDLATGVET